MAGLEAPDHVKPAVMAAFRSARPRRQVRGYRWAICGSGRGVGSCCAVLECSTGHTRRQGGSGHEVEPAKAVAARNVCRKNRSTGGAGGPEAGPRPQAARAATGTCRGASTHHAGRSRRSLSHCPTRRPSTRTRTRQVVRVRLPRSAMRSVGLPVNEDRWMEQVPADVLLGQDGVARAVRFVKVAQ